MRRRGGRCGGGHRRGPWPRAVGRVVVAEPDCFWVFPGGVPDVYCPLVEFEMPVVPPGGMAEITMVAWRDLPGLAPLVPGTYAFTWPLLVRGPDDAGTPGSVTLTFAVP